MQNDVKENLEYSVMCPAQKLHTSASFKITQYIAIKHNWDLSNFKPAHIAHTVSSLTTLSGLHVLAEVKHKGSSAS